VDEYETAVALAFKRRGKPSLTEAELRQVLSFELNWYPPAAARRFIEEVRRRGLVREDRDGLVPVLENWPVNTPLDFKPPEAAGTDAPSLRERIALLPEANGVSNVDMAESLASLDAKSRGLHSREALTLFLLARRKVDVRGLARELSEEILG
jgi:hypothetical protein